MAVEISRTPKSLCWVVIRNPISFWMDFGAEMVLLMVRSACAQMQKIGSLTAATHVPKWREESYQRHCSCQEYSFGSQQMQGTLPLEALHLGLTSEVAFSTRPLTCRL